MGALHNNVSLFAIFLPKTIKIGGNLTKFKKKQFCTVYLRHGVEASCAVNSLRCCTCGLPVVARTFCILLHSQGTSAH